MALGRSNGISTAVSIVLGVVAAVIAVVGGLYWLGKRLGPEHAGACTLRLKARPESAWKLLTDVERIGEWWSVAKKGRVVPIEETSGAAAAWKGTAGGGPPVRVFVSGKKNAGSFVLRTTRLSPIAGQGPEEAGVIERELEDHSRGTRQVWAYAVIRDAAGTTRVRLSSRGRVERPIARAIMRHIVGDDGSIRRHLQDLAAALGEEPRFEE